jgi:hypothetical protein
MALRLMPMIGYDVLCGKYAREEVEVGVLVFKHVVAEFFFRGVGAVLFEAALSGSSHGRFRSLGIESTS